MMNIDKNLRIVYMGTPEFAVAPMKVLIDAGYNVVGVVTAADKPAGRGRKLSESAVKQYVVGVNSIRATHGEDQIALLQPEKLRDEAWLAQLAALNADLFIVVAFRMLPEIVWSMPRLGTFNLHASLLPLYRGAAPINWAIINGETKTGVTTFFLNAQIDRGEIIEQQEIDIDKSDNAGTLHDKLMKLGSQLVLKTVEAIAQGSVKSRSQIEIHDIKRTSAPKIFKPDCMINWNSDGISISNKIRGLSPYPAAWTELDGGRFSAKIISAHFEPQSALTVPQVSNVDSDMKTYYRIGCTDGWIYVDTLLPIGKREMPIADFLRGYHR